MSKHNAMLQWPRDGERYLPSFFVGSEGENGEHMRDCGGWPYSVYLHANETGVTDAVLCHGIQHIADARDLCDLLNNR